MEKESGQTADKKCRIYVARAASMYIALDHISPNCDYDLIRPELRS